MVEPDDQEDHLGLMKPAKNRDFLILGFVAVLIIGGFILLTFKLIDQEDTHVRNVEKVKIAEGFSYDQIGSDEAEQTLHGLINKPSPRNSADFSTLNFTDEMMKRVATIKELKSLDVSHTKVTDEGLKRIVKLPLVELELVQCAITDEGLKSVAKIKTLEKLNISETAVSDAGVPDLLKLPKLDDLSIAATKITDEGVAILVDHPTLTRLDITSNGVTDRCLKDISRMHLSNLIANSTNITGPGIGKFLKSTTLRKVGFAGCHVEDEDIARFPAAMPGVLSIDLSTTRLTNKGLDSLADWKALVSVKLRHLDHATAEGLQNFRNRRPNCSVSLDKLN